MSNIKHNYTNELELKSLLIRVKNKKEHTGSTKYNIRINKYLKWFDTISKYKTDNVTKRAQLKRTLKERVISLSEKTCVDTRSYERFGEIILLMIKNILRKPNFSGYTYTDDFYSDSVSKVLKYLHNFNHKLISERTNQPVNAFAYISQYIHNSIVFVLNTKKKDQEGLQKIINADSTNKQNVTIFDEVRDSYYKESQIEKEEHEEIFEFDYIDESSTTLYDLIKELNISYNKNIRTIIIYPNDYRISFDEYSNLKDVLTPNLSIQRKE